MPHADVAPPGRAAASDAFDLVLAGDRVLVDGAFAPAEVGVRDGLVARIAEAGAGLAGARHVRLADDEVLIPGLVDTHVHVNEPGRTEWEGFASATRAAAAGGITTIVDMPLNSIPPTTSVDALVVKRAAAEGRVFVDVGFWGGLVPGNVGDLLPLVGEGVFGFKCFLVDSGVAEFPPVSADEMERAMAVLAEAGSLLIVHAEDAAIIDEAPHEHGADYADFLASRPRAAEHAAIAAVIEAARRTGADAHILHLSSADALGPIAWAKHDGVRITAETCPHYLVLAAEDVAPGATAFKCCPPIREGSNRDALWRGLEEGVIDLVVSDHSPAPAALKLAGDGDFAEAWGGIASLQLGLPIVWTEARRRGIRLEQVVEWMSTAPARRVGLSSKGAIEVGRAADLAVVAPDAVFTVDAAALEHRHPISPYDGRELVGVVRATYLAGEPVDREVPRGRLLQRADRRVAAMSLDAFNEADREAAIAMLRPCLDIDRWCEQVADARPYGSVDELVAWAETAASPFTPAEVEGALAHHPRIGERPTGASAEAAMSRSEQSGVDPADAEVAAGLAAGNRAYEERFGRVFLIRAAGRSSREILDALTERLGHTPEEEDPVVADQLRQIAVLRLKGLVA
ncbi:allantoinase AllB [Agromyces mariniharenae]|uniref:allantoinase n=2 Tax=Agromyces mariniharenae TaxID=2604423 RepID=A0A5S4V0F0_9MICO|nr:allantoinase AllB [Agromyces mariniharenae]